MIINGIINELNLDNFLDKNFEIIEKLWFQKIDMYYYSNNEYKIHLSKIDKKIIAKSKDCLEKLKILNFKKNIKIDNYKL